MIHPTDLDRRHRCRHRPSRWLVSGVVLAVPWILASYLLVPTLIVDAYHGQSYPFFNRILTGQEFHDVDHYLWKWDYFAKLCVVTILGSSMALYLAATRHAGERVPWLDSLAARNNSSARQAITLAFSILASAGTFSVLASVLCADLGNRQIIKAVTFEDGLIQMATFGFLVVGTVFAIATFLSVKELRSDFMLVSFLMVLYTLRELDHYILLRIGRPSDKWMPFYTGPSPLYAKLAFTLLMVAIAFAIFALIKRRSVFSAIARRETWAICGVVWGISLGASQFIDKFWRTNDLRFYSFEEALEMCAGAICCLVVYCMVYQASELGRAEAAG